MDLLGQFQSNDFSVPSLTSSTHADRRVHELEAEVSSLTNRILVLQNENNDLRSVQVANNTLPVYVEEAEEPTFLV